VLEQPELLFFESLLSKDARWLVCLFVFKGAENPFFSPLAVLSTGIMWIPSTASTGGWKVATKLMMAWLNFTSEKFHSGGEGIEHGNPGGMELAAVGSWVLDTPWGTFGSR
jgi:hypothetical protein